MTMTQAEASALVQEYTGLRLLESLQLLREDLSDTPTDVRVAYYQLMAGFTAMFAPAD